MAINPDLVKVGDILYDVHRHKMGNTTMSCLGCWTVRIIEIIPNTYGNAYLVSWNGNRPEKWYADRIRRLRRSPLKEQA